MSNRWLIDKKRLTTRFFEHNEALKVFTSQSFRNFKRYAFRVVYIFTRLITISHFFFAFIYFFFDNVISFDILFSFFIDVKFNRIFIKIVNRIAKNIDRIQIFENIFFNDVLHDSNSFTFSVFKRFVKRFLNDIIVNANNKSKKQ